MHLRRLPSLPLLKSTRRLGWRSEADLPHSSLNSSGSGQVTTQGEPPSPIYSDFSVNFRFWQKGFFFMNICLMCQQKSEKVITKNFTEI